MNAKSFRRNHGAKTKSSSSSFISLHFNKADEDQLEFSYMEDKKPKENQASSEATQSKFTLYLPEHPKSADHPKRTDGAAPSDITDGPRDELNTEHLNSAVRERSKTSEDIVKNVGDGRPNRNSFVEFVRLDPPPVHVSDCSSTLEEDLKLSPAVEAAEIDDKDSFDSYLSGELEKARRDMLCDAKREEPSSSYEPQDPVSLPATEESCKSRGGDLFSVGLCKMASFIRFSRNSVPVHWLVVVLACVCAPIPSWLSGFLVGVILSGSVVYWLYRPQKKRRTQSFSYLLPHAATAKRGKQLEDSDILKGWMNELPSPLDYHPDRYHVSCTRSVYVRLDGSYVRFSYPAKNVPKRAMFNEPRLDMQFVHQQHYDMTDASVELLPKGLANKRLWSKKYPICLKISLKQSSTKVTNKKFPPRTTDNEIVLYLFSRTDREKSLWYSRLLKASRAKLGGCHSPVLSARIVGGGEGSSFLEGKRTLSVDFALLKQEEEDETDNDGFVEVNMSRQQKFQMYMSALMHAEHPFLGGGKAPSEPGTKPGNLAWLNVMIGRLFFDFLVEDAWAQLITEKIQKKLNRIKLPFFLSELTVKDIHLGSSLPKIHGASDPWTDERGLWTDVDLSYNGSFHMTLETKLSFSRFKGEGEELWNPVSEDSKDSASNQQSLYNDDEDSVESSSDDDLPEDNTDGVPAEGVERSHGKKLLKLVDRLAQSSYFQHAAKNKYVQKAMNDLSNTPLVLTVEVQWLTGTLALNIPPWPTDRLWYGFRKNPSLSITARPKLGQHVVTFTQVTEWIEKKLLSEFQKVLVMPNMDDLIIPTMQSCQDIIVTSHPDK